MLDYVSYTAILLCDLHNMDQVIIQKLTIHYFRRKIGNPGIFSSWTASNKCNV